MCFSRAIVAFLLGCAVKIYIVVRNDISFSSSRHETWFLCNILELYYSSLIMHCFNYTSKFMYSYNRVELSICCSHSLVFNTCVYCGVWRILLLISSACGNILLKIFKTPYSWPSHRLCCYSILNFCIALIVYK